MEDVLSQKSNRSVVGLVSLVAIFFIVLIIFSVYTVKIFNASDEKSALDFSGSEGGDKIAVIEVEGVIMESKKYVELLQKAEEDKKSKAIIIRINSPGGAVAPTQEVYNEIRRIDEAYSTSKGKKGKPVYSSFGSISASGGYYLGASTRKICALPGTLTGSIGVIMQFMDLSRLYEWAMVNPQVVKAGRYKDIGQPNRALTPEEKALMDKMINNVHDQFIRDIEKTRSKKIKGNIRDHAQGQIFSGEGAFELGLVDELSSLWDCARNIHKELKLEGEMSLKYIKKKKKKKFIDFLTDIEEVTSGIKELIGQTKAPALMYK